MGHVRGHGATVASMVGRALGFDSKSKSYVITMMVVFRFDF